MLRSGIEPVGIVAGFARIEATPSATTIAKTRMRGTVAANIELGDLTRSVYESRRRALRRLMTDAHALKASGVVGIQFDLERSGSSTH